MKALHRAAAIRAYRTLATGLAGSGVSTALAAVIAAALGAGDDTLRVALIAAGSSLGAVAVSALTSFWRGVAQGLPEVEGEDA